MPETRERQARPVTTREYKLILTADRFFDRRKGAAALGELVSYSLRDRDSDIEFQGKEEIRATYYVDTRDFLLRRAGYAIRVRFEEDEGQFKLSLKHRTPDRYLAAARDLSSAHGDGVEKFEEDILPPFRSIFSQSNALWFDDEPDLSTLAKAARIFPGLADLGPPGTILCKVNDVTVREVFHKLCKIKLDRKKPKIKLGLSFWYLSDDSRWPIIAECAYDYRADQGDDFALHVVQGANTLFRRLQRQPGWFDANATTKTRFVYEGLS